MITTIIQRAVMQGTPLLLGSTGEILTEKSGHLNLGIPGIMYVGAISGVAGAFLYELSFSNPAMINPLLAVIIPLICSIIGSTLMGLIYCFLTVTLRANQNVTGLALTTFGIGIGNFFGGSLIKLVDSDVPSIALSNTCKVVLPFAGMLKEKRLSLPVASPLKSVPTPRMFAYRGFPSLSWPTNTTL